MMSPRFLSNRKLGNLMEDTVECNIITLGYNESKCCACVKAHALNKKMLHSVKKVVPRNIAKPEALAYG